MSNKIEDIRARHERDDRLRDGLAPGAHADRDFLLAEVDRQRAEIERLGASILSLAKSLRASLDAAIRQRDEARTEIERLKRDSDEACDESNPVQEPVAWRNKNWGHFTINPIASKHPDWEPLYTEQQTRQRRNALEGRP